jgi:hypothetical protein
LNVQEYIQSGAIEACLMGLATREEQAELVLLKAQYPEVKAAAEAFETALEEQALSGAVTPPAFVKERIMEAVRPATSAPAPIVSMPPYSQPKPKPKFSYAAAAAVAILLGSLVMNFMLMGRVKGLQKEVVALKDTKPVDKGIDIANVMRNPGITPVAMYGVGTHQICRCSLFWDRKEKKAYLVVHHLVSPAPGKEYHLWADVNGKLQDVGSFDIGDRSQPILIPGMPQNANGFKVTLETKDGPKNQPDMDQLYLDGKIA